MKRYERYKDSGVEWIGEIPDGWEVKRFKRLYRFSMGATILKTDLKNNGNIPVFSATEGDEIFGFVNDSNVILEKNDFVIPARGNSIGHVYLVEGLSTCTQTTIYAKPLYPNIYEARYFLYFQKGLREHLFQFDRTAIPQITVDQVKNNYATIPSKTTQTAIASYLDRKTAEIDELIAQKERLIELYEEEKTAIINQAVTKGIDPDAKLKDSGVDWLGEIPEGWVVKRLRYVGNCQNGVSKGADYFGTGFPFVSYSDVYNNFVLSQNVEGLANSTEIDQVNYSVIKGDIFFTRTSETIEEIGISSTCLETINRAIFSGFLIRFRPFDSILFEGFSKYFFRSKLHRLFFVKEMNLVTRASLSQELLKRLPVTLPPFLEQCEIASYLDQATSSIEAKIEKTKKIIELQKEYRTAMISEVVTGKIKVTEETTP